MMPMNVSNINNVTLQVDGLVEVSEDNTHWPLKDPKNVWDFWTITDSSNIHIKGNGTVSGNGYWWWVREFMV